MQGQVTAKNSLFHNGEVQEYVRMCDLLPARRVLVVGDIMVDEYIWGEVRRISPEAPVPVVWVKNETAQLGGAANVAHNLISLEANVSVVGVLGEDHLGSRVIAALDRLGIERSGILQLKEYQTIQKTRIVAHNQQVVRVDRETITPVPQDFESHILNYCQKKMDDVDAVILSDYAKGVITENLASSIIRRARDKNIICAIDPKVHRTDFYKYCTVITPNHLEASLMSGIGIDEEDATSRAGKELLRRLDAEAVLITCGERGMALLEKEKPMEMIDTVARSVYDVTGAGDTVISTLTLGMAAGIPIRDSAVLANFAAGVVVGKVGTATVTIPEMKKAIKSFAT